MKTTGNTILITGGGSGIGRGLAESFHALGNQVIIAGRNRRNLDEVTAANPGMKALTVDLTRPDGIRAFAIRVAEENPALNALINNAGIMRPESLLETYETHLADAELMVTTNLLGPIRLTAALLPQLRRQASASVINVSSGLAFVPLAMTPTYCATKAALHSYTQSLRLQLRETSIEVIELIPPYVATTLMGEHQAEDPRAMPLTDFIREAMALLETGVAEICVERVHPLRFASEAGREKYEKFFARLNETVDAELRDG